jgi:dipeptidyl aminopeptidase/acylaminoacyl peptidase
VRYLLAGIGLLTASAAAQQAEPSKPLPVEAFASLPFMEGPRLSPDGTRIAARVAIAGTQRLVIFPLADSSRPAAVGLGGNDLNWWSWVNNDWLVVGVGTSAPVRGEQWYVRRAVGVSSDGKFVRPLAFREAAQGADDVLWMASDGTPRILLAMQKSIYPNEPEFWPQVYEVDVSTGKMKQAVDSHPSVMSWYADATGAVRIGIGYDDERGQSRLLYREGAKGLFRTVDRANTRKNEELSVPALFLPEPGKALAFDSSDGFNALYELDLASLKLGRKVFGAEGYDLGSLTTDVSGSTLAGISYTAEYRKMQWLDPSLAQVQAEIDKAVGDRRAEIVSLSKDRTKMIVKVGSASQPGSYFFYDTGEGVMRLVAHTNATLKSARLAPVKTVHYAARDGLRIPAVLTLPKGRAAKGLPLIVMPHGGPAVRDSEEWDWWAQFLADRGYAVVQPNYRGSTGFGTAFLEKGEGEWGLKMQDDLNDAVAHLAKLGIADPKRVCMVGASYGGYAALRAAQRDGGLYRCAVSYAGVADLGHLARFDSRSLYGKSARAYLKEKAPDFKAVSPINFPQQFSAPVLLVHGKKDLRVPVAQSREMAEKLRKAGKPVDYVEQEEGDHHFSREQDRLQFLQLLEAFLKKHNPA